jgi:hypothetical protein
VRDQRFSREPPWRGQRDLAGVGEIHAVRLRASVLVRDADSVDRMPDSPAGQHGSE